MFDYLRKIARRFVIPEDKGRAEAVSEPRDTGFTKDLKKNERLLVERLGESPDIIWRQFNLGFGKFQDAMIVFIDGMTDKNAIQDHILRPLMNESAQWREENTRKLDINEKSIMERLLTVGEMKTVTTVEDVVDAVLAGDTALFIQDLDSAIIMSTRGWEKRSISEPDTEIVVKGPREGFVESLRTNTALLRRKIGSSGLTLFTLRVGEKSKTDICIAYLKEVANPKVVEEVKRRLRRIDTDGILAVGFVEQFIEDAPFSPFPTISYSERPDVVAAKLMEGRVAIITEGTPVVNVVPMLYVESFQSPDDYNFRPFYSTMVRWFRYSAYTLSIILPSLYVALTTYHQELIPTQLLITMAAANEGSPFPAVVEAIGMGIVFEVLREAGIRLPRPIGQAVSIVGALVIGEATVSAGLVGAPVVIIIAFTAIASFVVPQQNEAGAIIRVGLTVLAGVLGLYGVLGGLLMVLTHMASLRSFGVPYFSPIAPLTFRDLKDVLIRAPIWAMWTRPRLIGWHNPVRQAIKFGPRPPSDSNSSDDDQ